MKQSDIKLLKSRSKFHLFMTVLTLVDIIGIPFNLGCLIIAIVNDVSELIPFFSFALLVIVVLTIFAKIYRAKHGFEKSPVEPYEIKMAPTDFDTFKHKLGFFTDEAVYNDIYCSLIHDKKDIVLIAPYINDASSARIEELFLKSERNRAVEIAINEGILPKTTTQFQLHRTGTLILYVFEEVNEAVLDLMRENIDRESTLTAAVDLRSGKIYVRALWGGIWADDVMYRYMLKKLLSAV